MAQVEEFTPRDYQIDLYEKAISGNTIIYLPTGSGKTYIVVMVIKKMSEDVRKPWKEGGKRSFFLVNTIPLVAQQCAYISRHSDLTCSGYSGDMNINFWNIDMWTKEFEKNQVLVMTSQILVDILNHGYIALENINLIIFDECHHAVGDHPMRLVMKRFEDCPVDKQPKVMGTSATLLNSNVGLEQVEENVRELEITFHATVITVDSMASVKNYGKPNEFLKYYEPQQQSNIDDKLMEYIDNAIKVLDVVKLSTSETINKSSKVFQPKSKSAKFKCVFEDIREHLQTQGLYVAYKAILCHMIQFEQIKQCTEDLQSIAVIDFLLTQLTLMRKIISNEMKSPSELENLLNYSSDQVKQLFNNIHEFYHDSITTNQKFCCFIFVRRRFTAKVLYHVLFNRAHYDPEFSFLVPQYVIGNNTDSLKRPCENMSLRKWNQEALINFRKGIVNCLIATDVLDEGIDVPSCSLVIRYDMPQDFRAYVQSKGRSRHKDSHYIILLPNDSSVAEKCTGYRKVEETLSKKLIGNSIERFQPLPKELEANLYTSEIEPFTVVNSKGLRSVVTEVSAISLINRYCATFSKSKYINCSPTLILHKGKDKDNPHQEAYMVSIDLPRISPLKEKIFGKVMPSIISAKRSAAMETCKKLYEIGELNENLVPKTSSHVTGDISSVLAQWQIENDGKKVGSPCKTQSQNILQGPLPTFHI